MPSVSPRGSREFKDPAHALYGSLVSPGRLVYPQSTQEHQMLIDKIVAHHRAGGHVAIADGTFDVPHEGHHWYLRLCRLEAARRHYGLLFEGAQTQARIRLVASSDIMLIVTVDADYKVACLKGYVPEKGNVYRPVYPWCARANMVAGYMIPNGLGAYKPIVDTVTVEGEPEHAGTALESHLAFGEHLQRLGVLGTWLIYGEHAKTARMAQAIAGDKISLIMPDTVIRSTEWGSSTIIKRILQQ
jgi:hypothetical protein